ncbi:hypothetical protein [Alicyclobacillus fodiniaquatilis]|uniref:YtzH-like protein n=1 Tax=Alicyclobacillus fodiniaquatilis TaxID=1661150 RepID=A0ABW4JTP8_9BACL
MNPLIIEIHKSANQLPQCISEGNASEVHNQMSYVNSLVEQLSQSVLDGEERTMLLEVVRVIQKSNQLIVHRMDLSKLAVQQVRKNQKHDWYA